MPNTKPDQVPPLPEHARERLQAKVREVFGSPRPWTQGVRGAIKRHNASNIYDANGSSVASLSGVPLHCSVEDLERSGNQSDAEGMANAKLIVRAVNYHEDLLEACREAYHSICPVGGSLSEYRILNPDKLISMLESVLEKSGAQ